MVTQRDVLTFPGQDMSIRSIEFSPDGSSLVGVSWGGNLYLWRAPSLAEIDAIEQGKNKDQIRPPW
jgi:WD40 repeat protein